MAEIFVVGHRNPDNDAIMSASVLADLKNKLDGDNHYKAVRLGPLPAESELVFTEFGVEAPELIDHVDEGQKIILTDHNELGQAVAGIDKAEVVEIVDHHRIADVSTANPILFLNLPIGSTATIVTLQFRQTGIELPDSIARVLLSAILTDTVIMKSPTCTQRDIDVANRMARIANISQITFDSLPHNSAVVLTLNACNVTHREGYKHVAVTTVLNTTIATIIAILFAMIGIR